MRWITAFLTVTRTSFKELRATDRGARENRGVRQQPQFLQLHGLQRHVAPLAHPQFCSTLGWLESVMFSFLFCIARSERITI
jgi:hypothetical protein